jgi:outer membrane protein assembly factor BamB
MPESNNQTQKILLLLAILSPVLWQTYPHIKAYLEAEQPQLVAIDAASGQVKWRTNLPDATDKLHTTPIVLSRDRILVTQFAKAGTSGTACAWVEFDRNSGRIVWHQDPQSLGINGCPAPYLASVAQDGKLYTFWRKSINHGEQSAQGILAMDFTTRQVQWTVPIELRWRDDSLEKALTLTNGRLIAGISDSLQREKGIALKSLDPRTGDTIWQAHLDDATMHQLTSLEKSLIVSTGEGRSMNIFQYYKIGDRWQIYNIDTGKPIAAYSGSEQLQIRQIFPKGDQLYALTTNDLAQKIANRTIAKVRIADEKFTLENRSHNLAADNICPDLSNVYSANHMFLAVCVKSGEIEAVALDTQTYKPWWYVGVRPSSTIEADSLGDHIFITDKDQIRAIRVSDGKPVWSIPTAYASPSKIDGDTLFTIIRTSRKDFWKINQLKPSKP